MNILFYMPTVLYGGVRTVSEILSDGFQKNGHKVIWLLLYRIYGDDRDYPLGRDVVYLPSRELNAVDNVNFYRKFVRDNSIDVIINQNGLYDGVNLIDALDNDEVSRVSVIHSNPISNYQWLFKDTITLKTKTVKEYFKRFARLLLYYKIKRLTYQSIVSHFNLLHRGQSHIVVLSPSYIDTVKTVNKNISKISAIANPNTYQFVNIQPKEKIVLFVGRLDNRSKKIQTLLEIWKKVQLKIKDKGWKLLIVGEGPDGESLRRQAQNIPNIEFTGYQNPRKYYERASILCMTSLFEGFPMTITEAMQHGCVPIAFNSFPAVTDIINDGEDGVIIKPFDKNNYANKLLQLMQDEDMRTRLSTSAISNVTRFDADKIIYQWIDLFKRLKLEHQK